MDRRERYAWSDIWEWLKKIDVAGMAFCDVCGKTINYRSSGKKAFRVHAEDSNHKAKLKIIKSNQVKSVFYLSSWEKVVL